MTDHDRIVDKIVKGSQEEFYENFDAALDKWLDKQFALFGKWALRGVAAALFVWLLKVAVAAGVFK